MALTAREVVDRIQRQIGPAWKSSPVDRFHSGNGESDVLGIVTTFAPSLEVLRRAVAAKRNMIISREAPFWARGGAQGAIEQDAAYRAKRQYIEANGLILYRLFDNWNARKPDGQLLGLSRALGWTHDNGFVALAPATLQETARSIKRTLKMKSIRVIGDPNTGVTKAVLLHGMCTVRDLEQHLEEPGVDLVVIGEPIEWEASPYFADLVASGQKKGLIVLGQEVSEEPGCGEMANWIKSFIPEVSVEWMPTGEPAWMPY